MTDTTISSALKRNAGVLIGYQGWVLGLTMVLVGAGELGLLVRFIAPSFLISLALALEAAFLLELIGWARPGDLVLRRTALQGLLLGHMGVMLLVISEWVMPEVLRSESFREAVDLTYSLTTVPVWVVVLMIAAGCVQLARAFARALRNE